MIVMALVEVGMYFRPSRPRVSRFFFRCANRYAYACRWLRAAPARFEARIEEADADRFIAQLDRITNVIFCGLLVIFAVWLIYNICRHVPTTIPEGF